MNYFKTAILTSFALALLIIGVLLHIHGSKPKYEAGDCVRLYVLGNNQPAASFAEIKIVDIIDKSSDIKAINKSIDAPQYEAPRYYSVGLFDQEEDSISVGYLIPTKDLDALTSATTFWRNESAGGADDGCKKHDRE